MKKIILDYGGDNQLVVHDKTSSIDFVLANTDISGLELPEVDRVSFKNPQQDGEFLSSNFYNGRVISWRQGIYGDDASTYLTNRQSLMAALSISRDSYGRAQTKVIYFLDDDDSEYRTEYVMGKLSLPRQYVTYATGGIVLFCPDTAILSNTLSTASVMLASGGGFSIPFSIPFDIAPTIGGSVTVTNSGNIEAWPTILLSGPATSPAISNQTTGKILTFSNIGLAAGSSITIDMKNRTIYSGTQNYFQYKTTASDFWSLAPGSNKIKLTDTVFDERESALVSFRSSYAGL